MCIRALAVLIFLASASPVLAPPARAPGVSCALEVSYPLQVEVHLMEAQAPGKWLQAEVEVQSDLDLADVEILLTGDSGVELAGSRKASWSALAGATPRRLGFGLRLQDTVQPQQVRVRVRGTAEGLRLERGAVLQLLPRGRQHPPQISEARSGARSVLEYRGEARREP